MVFLTYVEKVKLAKMMDETGIAVINVGFPGLSEDEKRSVKRIVNESFSKATLTALSAAAKTHVDACLEAGMKEINIEAAINGLNLKYRLRISKDEAVKRIVESIEYAKKHGVTVNFVLSDGSRTPLEDILTIFEKAVAAGATKLAIADTVGFLRPLAMRYLISHVRDGLPDAVRKKIPLSVHCHNDFGLATANTLASVEEGATYLHTSLIGYGERAGWHHLKKWSQPWNCYTTLIRASTWNEYTDWRN